MCSALLYCVERAVLCSFPDLKSVQCCAVQSLQYCSERAVLCRACRAVQCRACSIVQSVPCCAKRAVLRRTCRAVQSVPCCAERAVLFRACRVVQTVPCRAVQSVQRCALLRGQAATAAFMTGRSLPTPQLPPLDGGDQVLQGKVVWGFHSSRERR